MSNNRGNEKISRRLCSDLLQDMLNKKISAQDVINTWPKDTGDSIIDTIYGLLFHYRDDEDIRKKDTRYAKWQDEEIEKMIRSLLGEEGD